MSDYSNITVPAVKGLNRDDAVKKLWSLGLVSWKFHPAQLDIYDAINQWKGSRFVMNCSRQIGKSFMLCGYAVEYALQHPGARIHYLAPTAKMVKRIILPRLSEILSDCPKELQPEYRVNDQIYRFKNGSEIQISGTDSERAENLRGQIAHLVICDEAGFMDKLDYVVVSILTPMTITVSGRLILSSTPPISPDHPFKTMAEQADQDGCYIKKTIHDNPLITDEVKLQYMKEARGPDSVAWRREFLAEFIIDEKEAVIPEATDEKIASCVKQIIEPTGNPPEEGQTLKPLFYDSYVVADLGYTDNTGILFGYWDFMRACLVIEDEAMFNKPNTQMIADIIRKKEGLLWKGKQAYLRFADGNLITISDLNTMHGLSFTVTKNDELEASVNACRLFVDQNKIIIDPRCKNLIAQLKSATWDKTRKKFNRSTVHGHYDLLAALIYMIRNVRRHKNPYPPGLGLDINTMFLPQNTQHDKGHLELAKAMNPVNRFFKRDE